MYITEGSVTSDKCPPTRIMGPVGADHGDHQHAGHHHGVTTGADRRLLVLALVMITALMAGEVVVGLLSGSVALLADAAHLLTDAGAIALALITMKIAARPPSGGYTYGLTRTEILSALGNGFTLLLLAGWLAVEATGRLITAPPVDGAPMLITALVGCVVNVAAVVTVGRANRTSLNVEGAFQHILTDLYAFVATALAGAVILVSDFYRADAIASLVVVALMVHSGARLVRDAGRIFLEAAPAGLDPAELGTRLASVPGVVELHDLHVWQVTSGYPALSAHVLVASGQDCHAVRVEIEKYLRANHAITHSTLQVDHVDEHNVVPPQEHLGPGDESKHCPDAHGRSYRPVSTAT